MLAGSAETVGALVTAVTFFGTGFTGSTLGVGVVVLGGSTFGASIVLVFGEVFATGFSIFGFSTFGFSTFGGGVTFGFSTVDFTLVVAGVELFGALSSLSSKSAKDIRKPPIERVDPDDVIKPLKELE